MASARADERRVSVAVLDFGETETGRRAADRLAASLESHVAGAGLSLIDRGQSRVAARGIGYRGSLNMTLAEARDLGAAIGCDFFITGEAQAVRRLPSTGGPYYEAYASIFVVSARTGRLVLWERPTANAAAPQQAEAALLDRLGERASAYRSAILEARDRERDERRATLAQAGEDETLDLSGDDAQQQGDLTLPQPYRRLRPPYPETAARYEVEATVDALVEIDREGEVSRVEIARWAGYGLDETVVNTVRQLHFRPATRRGEATPVRVLLRYNFRRPPKAK